MRWATDCRRRAEPALPQDRPLALYEKQQGAMRLVELDARAEAAGLHIGQSLADARALAPGLMVREIDRAELTTAFAALADWHANASPLVMVQTDRAAYGDLVLDITGVAHLFGGEQAMLDRLTGRLAARGLSVAGAVADSIGSAWALAHFAPGQVASGDPAAVLARLPVAALRLDEAVVDSLMQLGLKRIGELLGRDRRGLSARFGKELLVRLDQALGGLEEKLTPRRPPPSHYADRRFAEPVGLIDDVLMTARDLAVRLGHDLERDGLGAQRFTLTLYRVDHQMMTLTVAAGRATRDAGHIARLFANRTERLGAEYDAGFGIDMMRLAADTLSPLLPVQGGAFETRDGAADLAQLYDRMSSRLGGAVLQRVQFIDSHIPERAVQLVATDAVAQALPDAPVLPARPLRLLLHPEVVEVAMAEVPDGPPRAMVWRHTRHVFRRARGPERIAAEWWLDKAVPETTRGVADAEPAERSRTSAARKPDEERLRADTALAAGASQADERTRLSVFDAGATTRDYFMLEDDEGRRFWLFREGFYREGAVPNWFVHGFFA